jgi:hypothetical protein
VTGLPPFLARDRDPDAADRVVREVLNPNREWIMPRSVYVAKIDKFIVSRTAPVRAYVPGDPDPVVLQEFPGMDAFEAWYSPKRYRCLGVNAKAEFTDVMLEPGKGEATSEPAGGQGERPRRSRGAALVKDYIVNSHLAVLVKRFGYVQVSNEAHEPWTFRHPAGHEVVFRPPAPDKKSTSDWTLHVAKDGAQPKDGRGLVLEKDLEKLR